MNCVQKKAAQVHSRPSIYVVLFDLKFDVIKTPYLANCSYSYRIKTLWLHTVIHKGVCISDLRRNLIAKMEITKICMA